MGLTSSEVPATGARPVRHRTAPEPQATPPSVVGISNLRTFQHDASYPMMSTIEKRQALEIYKFGYPTLAWRYETLSQGGNGYSRQKLLLQPIDGVVNANYRCTDTPLLLDNLVDEVRLIPNTFP